MISQDNPIHDQRKSHDFLCSLLDNLETMKGDDILGRIFYIGVIYPSKEKKS